MKNLFQKSVFVILVFIAVFTGCKSSSKGAVSQRVDHTGLETLSGDLWDVNNGVKMGSYEFKQSGTGFYLYLQTDETKGITTFDGTKTFSPFEGIFEGDFKRTKDGFLVYGSDETDTYYVVIHDLPKEVLPANLPEHEKSGKSFLISVMDKAIFEEVFLAKRPRAETRFAIHALKPFMRTHAIISQ